MLKHIASEVTESDIQDFYAGIPGGEIKKQFVLNSEDTVIWRGPMASNALTRLIEKTNWGELDFLIVDMCPMEAIIIGFVSASLLLTATLTKGIPTSLVQLNVGAIIGIGVAKLGMKSIFKKTQVRQFFLMWLIAPLIAFLLSLLLVYTADNLKLL